LVFYQTKGAGCKPAPTLTTTQLQYKNGEMKEGKRFVKFFQSGKAMLACLSQIRVIDYRRLKNKLGDIDEQDFYRICRSFETLYKK